MDWVEWGVAQLVEVIVHVLIGKVAADERAINQAIGTSDLFQGACGFPLAEVVQ